jgi:hypothetical protein
VVHIQICNSNPDKILPVNVSALTIKAKGEKKLDNQAKTNPSFVVRMTLNLRTTLDQAHKPSSTPFPKSKQLQGFWVFNHHFPAVQRKKIFMFLCFDNLNEAVNSQCCQSNLKIIAYSNYKFK